MAYIKVAGSPTPVPLSPARSILVTLQMAGVPIQNLCGGQAKCGMCLVRVSNGAKYLSSVRPREAERLAALAAPSGTRLACQTHARGPVEIEILNPRSEGAHPGAGQPFPDEKAGPSHRD